MRCTTLARQQPSVILAKCAPEFYRVGVIIILVSKFSSLFYNHNLLMKRLRKICTVHKLLLFKKIAEAYLK